MPHRSIDPEAHQTLAILVESVAGPLLMAHPAPVCLEVDICPDLLVPTEASVAGQIVRAVTQQMLDQMPGGGDLMITAVQTEAGLELEFADDGPDIQQRPQTLPLAVAAAGARCTWQNCPQGGAALTVTFPRSANQAGIRKAA